ncbi:MAG TPA: trypsin-like peptidase domain-containing protein, partial [bacterium]|nr:trypsin-like peptidase domain-containing protein [bacterium]
MAEKTIARVCLVIFLMVWVSCDYIHISVGKKKENLSVTESPGQSQQEVPVSGVALKESTPATTTPVASQTQPSVPTTLTPEQIFSSYRDSIVEITMMDYLGRPTGTGSGVIISDKGLAVTNHHVLDVAVTAQVRLSNGGMYPVKEVKRVDEANDLVTFVIDASTTPMKPVPLGNSKTLKVGEPVVAIGNPAGLERTLSTGNVSGFRKVSGVDDWVQFTAPISHGSSGGAIFDMKGQLVGVVFSSGVDAERTNQNLNFAVPINVLKHMVAGEIVFSNEETLAFLKDERDYLSVNFSLFANLQGYQSIEPVLAYNRVQNYDGYMRELSRFRSQEMVRLGFLNRLQT